VLSAFSIESRQILEPSRFLGSCLTLAWQLLWSIEPNFLALCLVDRSSIHRDHPLVVDRSSIDSLLSNFKARQILDRNLNPSSCVFYLTLGRDFRFHFLFSLSIDPNPSPSLKSSLQSRFRPSSSLVLMVWL